MKPIEFKEANHRFAEHQDEYQTLPACYGRPEINPKGYVITCWKMSFIERLRILFKGVIWSSTMTFHQPLQPQYFTTKKSDLIAKPKINNY
ncbi:MAG: hypothetical protein RIC57_09090 [Balneola sp.]